MHKILLTVSLVAIALPGYGSDVVAQRARADQAWSASYRALVQELGALWKRDLHDQAAKQTGLSADDLSLALRYLRSYPVNDMQVKWVQVRYPHYNAEAVRGDLVRLEELGLLSPNDDVSWRLTSKGMAVLSGWYALAARYAAHYETSTRSITEIVLQVLDKIVASAAAEESGDINASMKWRLDHIFRVKDDAPLLLKIDERVWDYIAFINDVSHYRFDRYRRETGHAIAPELTALAKELFGTMRSGREYALANCIGQPVWRVSEVACRAAMQELVELDWVEPSGADTYRHTTAGASLFAEIEASSDRRLYATWNNVLFSEYRRYQEILKDMPALVESVQ